MRRLTILIWHVHGSWLDAFVRGPHRYLLAVRAGSASGRKRPAWPESVVEVTPEAARLERIDIVLFQRLQEVDEAAEYLGAGAERVAAFFVEHNAPQGRINEMRHPLADRADLALVHVTHFNALFWDTGETPSRVIEHGIADPGDLYAGDLARCAIIINEAERRGRVTGTDLLPIIERAAPYDLYGIGTPRDLPMRDLHASIARRRVYVHPFRWTSLGLALLEAMACGMPVIALGTTEVPYAVPPEAGIVSNRLDSILEGIRLVMNDRETARAMGKRARAHVLERYGLARFLDAWNGAFEEALGDRRPAFDPSGRRRSHRSSSSG